MSQEREPAERGGQAPRAPVGVVTDGVRRPARHAGLAVAMDVRRLDSSAQPRPAVACVRDGLVVVEGQVSVGRKGWRFSAEARRRRKRVTVQLVGRRDIDADRVPDIETYVYEVAILGLAPGSYEIYVSTAFPIPGAAGGIGTEPHYAGRVSLARAETQG